MRRGDHGSARTPTASASWIAEDADHVRASRSSCSALAERRAQSRSNRRSLARGVSPSSTAARRAAELAELINAKTPAKAEFVLWDKTYRGRGDDDVFVNATSIGLYPDVEGRVDADLSAVKRNAVVADVIPNPPRTLFLRDAEAQGLQTLDGLGMLVNQGVVSIRHWFGVDVEASVMRRTLETLFAA